MSLLRCEMHGNWDSDTHEGCPLCAEDRPPKAETPPAALAHYTEQAKLAVFDDLVAALKMCADAKKYQKRESAAINARAILARIDQLKGVQSE